jgi:hypothetical protein
MNGLLLEICRFESHCDRAISTPLSWRCFRERNFQLRLLSCQYESCMPAVAKAIRGGIGVLLSNWAEGWIGLDEACSLTRAPAQ